LEAQKAANGFAASVWRAGSVGYRNRTSLWDIRLSISEMNRTVHDNIHRIAGREDPPLMCPAAFGKISWPMPQKAKGNAVVSNNGNPSVK
jgi:hypothetical protein